MSLPKVVVLGGGHAGIFLAQDLHGYADVTLVDRKGFFEINWPNIRSYIHPELGDKIVVPFEEIPKITKTAVGAVERVSEDTVTLDNGTILKYDYLGICTGSTYSDCLGKARGGSVADRKREYKQGKDKLDAAKSVLIVGGGPVGVEVASEIATVYPEKKLTVVHSHDRLLQHRKKAMSKYALDLLQRNGAHVIFNDRIDKKEKGPFTTHKGVDIEADVMYWCAGISPNTEFMKHEFPHLLDEYGYIKVDRYLRAEGYTNIFALGDACNTPEIKLGYLAGKHGHTVAKSLKSVFKNGPEGASWQEWKPNFPMSAMIVSLGPNDGVAQFGSWVSKGWLVKMLKSHDLYVSRTRAEVGLPKV